MGDSELHRVLDILPDLVVQFDRDARFTYFNPAVLRAFEATSEQLIGHTNLELSGFVSEDSARMLHAHVLAVLAGRQPETVEVEFETKLGWRVFEVLH